jgi:hypothetical protein
MSPESHPLLILILTALLFIVGLAAYWLGYLLGFHAGAEAIDTRLHRNLNLPPRPQR